MKIQHFTQLKIWKDSVLLAKNIYTLTSNFPKHETYSLVDQLRRAVSSIGANIAEGFGRYSQKEKVHFYYIARGSLLEVEHFLYLSKELNYITDAQLKDYIKSCEELLISLQSYGKKLRQYL